ncbi:hypothetical protein CPB85DRAFT_1255212 [Mucidula mucida]|nr:hypothetical protein CPB85DRAFT_1255212 [Mucidula mucida]
MTRRPELTLLFSGIFSQVALLWELIPVQVDDMTTEDISRKVLGQHALVENWLPSLSSRRFYHCQDFAIEEDIVPTGMTTDKPRDYYLWLLTGAQLERSRQADLVFWTMFGSFYRRHCIFLAISGDTGRRWCSGA